MLEKQKKIYFTHIKGTNIRNIFPVLMFQQLLVNKQSPEHDLAEWRSAGHRHKLHHSNSGREVWFSLQTKKNKPRVD